MLAAIGGTCARERSASLDSVVATTVARKKSPPRRSPRSLGAPGSMHALSSPAICDAYEPSGKTTGLPSTRGCGAAISPSPPFSERKGSSPRHDLSTVKAEATSSASTQNSPTIHSATRATRD
eukprot:1088698-Pleurochrysis_carterae.AAC.3